MYIPFVGYDVPISLLEGQLYRIFWIVEVIQKQGLLSYHHTDLIEQEQGNVR